jgi:arsenical pump membrane protein
VSRPRGTPPEPEHTNLRNTEPTTPPSGTLRTTVGLATTLAALFACTGAVAASLLDPHSASHALGIDWPPFVLVAGLLLVGYVADREGVFRAAGNLLAWAPIGERAFLLLSLLGTGLVSALFNLDTAAAFVTPVVAYASRSRSCTLGTAGTTRPAGEGTPLYACLLGANAGSMLLPGSNLTNLIVLGPLHLTTGTFAERMAPAWAIALVASGVVLLATRSTTRRTSVRVGPLPTLRRPAERPGSPRPGTLGILAMMAGLACLLLVPSPAPAVAAVGVASLVLQWLHSRRTVTSPRPTGPGEIASEHPTLEDDDRRRISLFELMDPRVLVGLFGVAVALGTLGGDWSGPSRLLGHLDTYATAGLGALGSLVVNNLPAASLLSAGQVAHPYALLVGLNVGPDIFVTGSLSWVIWLKAARLAGETPSIGRASLLGLATVPPALLLAVWSLGLGTARP